VECERKYYFQSRQHYLKVIERRAILLFILIFFMSSIFFIVQAVNKKSSETVSPIKDTMKIIILRPPELKATKSVFTATESTYTQDELFCMAAAIYNEAGGDKCSDESRELVGYVILNRVNDSRFPNTIREVLEAKRQYGRFYWTGVKFADRSSLPQEQHAVKRAYEIAKKVLTTPSPIPKTVVFQAGFKQGDGVYKYIDGIYFCYKEVN